MAAFVSQNSRFSLQEKIRKMTISGIFVPKIFQVSSHITALMPNITGHALACTYITMFDVFRHANHYFIAEWSHGSYNEMNKSTSSEKHFLIVRACIVLCRFYVQAKIREISVAIRGSKFATRSARSGKGFFNLLHVLWDNTASFNRCNLAGYCPGNWANGYKMLPLVIEILSSILAAESLK